MIKFILALILLPSIAFAKNYLIERPDGSRVIETRTHAPESYLVEVPDELVGEDPTALDVSEETSPIGTVIKKVKVNEVNRALKKAEREAAKLARENEKVAKRNAKQAAKACLKTTPTAAEQRECIKIILRELFPDIDEAVAAAAK